MENKINNKEGKNCLHYDEVIFLNYKCGYCEKRTNYVKPYIIVGDKNCAVDCKSYKDKNENEK